MSSTSSEIKTFVFFDIETTGLPEYEYNKTRITELSMIAAERNHLLDTTGNDLPRVLQKLSLCVYPQKRIQPMALEITGLSNELLEYQKPFDCNTFNMIQTFLSQLPGPICLVAHNGNAFDYPILQKEIHRLKQNLSENILCADSIVAFRDLHEQKLMPDNFEKPTLGIVPLEPITGDTDDYSPYANIKLGSDSTEGFFGFISDKIQRNNETTPKRSTSAIYIQQKQLVKEERLNVGELENPMKSRRCLFLDKPKTSFKLVDIYERIYRKKAENSHRAEGDVIVLMHIAIACKDIFFKWCDKNAKPFHSIKEL